MCVSAPARFFASNVGSGGGNKKAASWGTCGFFLILFVFGFKTKSFAFKLALGRLREVAPGRCGGWSLPCDGVIFAVFGWGCKKKMIIFEKMC